MESVFCSFATSMGCTPSEHTDTFGEVWPSCPPPILPLPVRRHDLKPKPLLVPDHRQGHAHGPVAALCVERAPDELPQLAGGGRLRGRGILRVQAPPRRVVHGPPAPTAAPRPRRSPRTLHHCTRPYRCSSARSSRVWCGERSGPRVCESEGGLVEETASVHSSRPVVRPAPRRRSGGGDTTRSPGLLRRLAPGRWVRWGYYAGRCHSAPRHGSRSSR